MHTNNMQWLREQKGQSLLCHDEVCMSFVRAATIHLLIVFFLNIYIITILYLFYFITYNCAS